MAEGFDAVTYAAAKNYTDESLDGAGALKGAPCEITSIDDSVVGQHTVNFKWETESGTEYTDFMTIYDGAKGDKGDTGNPGQNGAAGQDGTTYVPEIGTVTTLPAGSAATASVVTDPLTEKAVFSFGIPKGQDGSGGGGGSTVSVTQVKSSGEKIATITVDGTGTDIYANTKDVVEYTRAEYNAAKQAGTVPNGVMVAITDEQGMDPTNYYTKTQTDSAISTAVSGKQNAIAQSATLTLAVASWDNQTKQQTVTFAHDTTKRNEIDITISELKTWADCGVVPVSETAAGITFECETIPESALTFKVTSMEVS